MGAHGNSGRSRPRWYHRRGKRLIDASVASLALLLTGPLLLTVMLALRWRLGPGILLHQQRVGRSGIPFGMLKLRTMEASRRESEAATGSYDGPERRTTHKSTADPRHTRLGRLVRKFSIDELPQLWNVVRGDMSLVGPRPELDAVATDAFRSHPRHLVRPGLTGPYQVSELRAAGDLTPGLDLDAGYAANVTFFGDMAYLARTVSALVRGTGS